MFIDKNEIEIATIVLAGWRERSPLLAAAFDYKLSVEMAQQQFPQRAFTRQDNESDWAFLTRLFKRRGIAWFVRPGRAMPGEDDDDDNGAPVHTLVLFVEQLRLPQNAAGTVRYHRADGTEEHDGGAPVIGLTAPGGIGFATSQAIVSYAATNIDTVAQQHLQLTAGQRFNVKAGKSVSLFAQQEGLTVIANYGKLLMQSQHDSTQIDAAKDVKISAKGRVIIMAEDIVLINSAGAYLSLKDGAPEIGGPGPMQVKTAGHHWDGPASKTAELPTFSEGSFARTPRLLRGSDGQPVKDMELGLQRDGAPPVPGTTDAAGAAGRTEADRMQQLVATFRAPRR